MPYEFPPNIRTLVDQYMATGQYTSEDQVLQAALHVLSDYQATVADIQTGMEDYAQGRAEPLSQAMEDVRQQLGLNR
jgi:hypothetical protein